MSAPLTEDGIAAEAPGQSYENQSYEPDPEDSQLARYTEAVLTGACVLSVATEPGKDPPPATRLTHDFLTAVEEFSASPFIADAFGEAYRKLYGDTKRKEAITFLRTVSDFDYQTYLPRI